MTMTATANVCGSCDGATLPGMPATCGHDDPLTLFTMAPAPAVRVILPTGPAETPDQFRARLDAHHAEAVAFFAGFNLTESETLS